jgi:hypothetical protein
MGETKKLTGSEKKKLAEKMSSAGAGTPMTAKEYQEWKKKHQSSSSSK